LEEQTTPKRKTWIILGIILVLIICCCTAVGYFAYTSYMSLQPLENADIEVSLQPVVEAGADLDFTITIINISEKSINLNSINMGQDFVDGIQIGDSTPIFEYRDHYDLLGFPMEMFIFNEMILVGESLTVEFDAKAVKTGDFTGQMFICVDNTTNCEIILLRTVVEESTQD
jgi:hypothetical protein